jgi:hypothetical protein
MSDPTLSIPVSINMPFTYTVTPANGGYGQGQVMLGIDPVNGAGYLIDLVPTTVTVSVPGAVPEPSTWAMMLIGLAGLGFTTYRRTRKAVVCRRLIKDSSVLSSLPRKSPLGDYARARASATITTVPPTI